MKEELPRGRYPRQRGIALVTALMVATVLSMLIGASLFVAMTHYGLNFAQARSESALLLAEGGVNTELAYIAANVGNSDVSTISSQPTIATGETMVYPGETHAVYGRKGSLPGTTNEYYWVCTSQNEWWKSGATPTAWDGKSGTFYITSTAYVRGSWRRVSVNASGLSIFSLYAIFALATYTNSSNSVGLSSATVDVVGAAGTNGTVSNSNSTFLASNLIDANTASVTTGQFTSANLKTGGTLLSQSSRIDYPTTTLVLKRTLGLTSYTDANAWTYIASNNNNANKVYTFKTGQTTISAANCQLASGTVGTTLTNAGSSLGSWSVATTATKSTLQPTSVSSPSTGSGSNLTYSLGNLTVTLSGNGTNFSVGERITIADNGSGLSSKFPQTIGSFFVKPINPKSNGTSSSFELYTSYDPSLRTDASQNYGLSGAITGTGTISWNGGATKPTIDTGVRTLIFEPGDYYFTSIQVAWNSNTQLYIDPQAIASGGTPGPVRFWVYDPSNGTQNDYIQVQVNSTLASGATEPDASLFRIFYGKDGKNFSFTRPSNATTYLGVDITTDFKVYGGVYSVTKVVGDSNTGTTIGFSGLTSASNGGTIILKGSLLADKISFQGFCQVVYVPTGSTADIAAGAGITGSYNDGG